MKKSIEWHEQCLKIMEGRLAQYRKRLVKLEQKIYSLNRKVQLYRMQIDVAGAKNKEGFDRNKYLIEEKEINT